MVCAHVGGCDSGENDCVVAAAARVEMVRNREVVEPVIWLSRGREIWNRSPDTALSEHRKDATPAAMMWISWTL